LIRVATHASDIDGIVSAALFLLKYSEAEITFLKIGDLRNVEEDEFDYIVDLPKTRKAKVNIDHHESNYKKLVKENRLTDKDLVDPKAPSAATLVFRYLKLHNSKKAIELVKMAEKADTGNHDKNLIKLDLVIKCANGDQDKLLTLARKLSEKGKKIFKDPWFKRAWKRIEPHYKVGERLAEKIAKKAKKMKIEALIIDLKSGYPRIAFGALAHKFLRNNGKVIAVINRMEEEDELCPPANTNNEKEKVIKISFRVSNESQFNARELAEKIGGGGHIKAAGCRTKLEEFENALGLIISEFSKYYQPVGYITIDLSNLKNVLSD